MRVVTAVKPMGGKGASRAARYVAESKLDPEREGERRPLFTDRDNDLTYSKANRLLTEGLGAPLKKDLIHFSTSFREEDFERLGTDDQPRVDRLREAAREAIREIKDDLGVGDWRWVAGIHLNTDHPHIHILIHKKVTDFETGKPRRLGNLPKRMLPHSRRGPDGEMHAATGMIGDRFIAALERAQERAHEIEREREEAVMSLRHDEERTKTTVKNGPAWIDQMLENASRNPSLGGRELTTELIERGPRPESSERPKPNEDIREALKNRSLDDRYYRTRDEHAGWLDRHSQELRDLYERGAEVKGDTLIIPTEEHEVSDERDGVRVIGIAHSYEKIHDPKLAVEFHFLARTIAGETADLGTEIKVFKHYYDQVEKDAEGRSLRPYDKNYEQKRAESLDRTLAEMRLLAGEMAKLETRESVEIALAKEPSIDAAHIIVSFEEMDERRRGVKDPEEEHSLPEEDLRYEADEYADDPDSTEYEFTIEEGYSEHEAEAAGWRFSTAAHKINLSRERLRFPEGLSYETREWLISNKLPELDRKIEDGHNLRDVKDEAGRVVAKGLLSQIDNLTQPEREDLLRRISKVAQLPEDKAQSRPSTPAELNEARRALLELSLDAKQRLESRSTLLSNRDRESLARVDALAQGLQAPLAKTIFDRASSRAENSTLYVSLGGEKGAFRVPVDNIRVYDAIQRMAEGAKLSLSTWQGKDGPPIINGFPEQEYDARGKIAGFLKNYLYERLRDPETRLIHDNENFRNAHKALVQAHTLEELNRAAYDFMSRNEREGKPLGERARKYLFNGRTPDHHTPEMVELRQIWGLTREGREQALRDGRLPPSPALSTMLTELDSRQSIKAVKQFQASLINPPEQMNNPGRLPLYRMHKQLLGHEQDYIYHLPHEKIRDLTSKVPAARETPVQEAPAQESPGKRAFGAAPQNGSYKEYIASLTEIRQRLLNETISRLEQSHGQVLTPEARDRIAREKHWDHLARAGNLALEKLAPPEVFAPQPGETARKLGDCIARLQQETQPRMLLAIHISDQVSTEKTADDDYERQVKAYAVGAREEMYRGFEAIDGLRKQLNRELRADRETLGAAITAAARYEAASYDYETARDRGETFRFRIHDVSANQERRISAFDVERRAEVRGNREANEFGAERAEDRREIKRQFSDRDIADHSPTLRDHSVVYKNLVEKLEAEKESTLRAHLHTGQRAEEVIERYQARGQELPAPFIDRKTISGLQEEAVERGLADRVDQLERLRVTLAAEYNQPVRLDEEAARLQAQLFTARTDLSTKEDRAERFDRTRHLRQWEIAGEKWSLADLNRQLERENDRASVFGRYTLHLDPGGRRRAKDEVERLTTIRETVAGKIGDQQNELRDQASVSERLVDVLSRAYDREQQSHAQTEKPMPEPRFTCEEIERVADNAATMRDATLLGQFQQIEARFNTYADPKERISPDRLLARAVGREITADIFHRESADRLAAFQERGDRLPLAIEKANGHLAVQKFRDTQPQSIAASILRPVLETNSDRELRGAAETALAQYRSHLMADFEKARSYRETACEITNRLHEEIVRHTGKDAGLPMPELSPKQQMQIEIYAERLSDQYERGYYLNLARSDSPYTAASRNPQTHTHTADRGEREAAAPAPEHVAGMGRGR